MYRSKYLIHLQTEYAQYISNMNSSVSAGNQQEHPELSLPAFRARVT